MFGNSATQKPEVLASKYIKEWIYSGICLALFEMVFSHTLHIVSCNIFSNRFKILVLRNNEKKPLIHGIPFTRGSILLLNSELETFSFTLQYFKENPEKVFHLDEIGSNFSFWICITAKEVEYFWNLRKSVVCTTKIFVAE